MKNRFMGNKVALGILAVLIAGMSSASAESDSNKGGKGADSDGMVLIPAGKFIFGKDDKKKELSLPAFKIDKYEVTNRQFAKFNLDYKYDAGADNFPATMVSFNDATDHCAALDKRLPTEQEWEKAARGTDGRIYPWGNEFDVAAGVFKDTDFEGNPAQKLKVGTHPKGQSPYGVHDMSGNVWEWTNTYEDRYAILKGGSFFEEGWTAKTTSRLRSIPNDSKDYAGFRCVKDVK